jgi:hypothetical protein
MSSSTPSDEPQLTDEQILAFEQKIKDEEAEKVEYRSWVLITFNQNLTISL